MMRKAITGILLSGTAVSIVAAGCSSNKPTTAPPVRVSTQVSSAPQIAPPATSPASPTSPTTTTSAEAAPDEATPDEATAIVTIDGSRKEYSGLRTCTNTEDGNTNIVISKPTDTYSISVSISQDGTVVRSVGLGNVDGLSLSYQEYQKGIHASVVRDGNTYTVTGTAVGYDNDELGKTFTKDFEVTVSCS